MKDKSMTGRLPIAVTDSANDTARFAFVTLADSVVDRACDHQIHQRLLDIWQRIECDKYLVQTAQALETAIEQDTPYWDLCCVLAAYADLCDPKRYLEIGVRRGRSAATVAAFCPDIELYLFDMWYPNYAGVPNPGPDFVRSQLEGVGHRGPVHVVSGRSQETIPAFFADQSHPQTLALITVDGDHRDAGAREDLENVIPHLAPGGMLVFDDIVHPDYATLHTTWQDVVTPHTSLCIRENVSDATGTAIAVASRHDGNAPNKGVVRYTGHTAANRASPSSAPL